MDFITLRRKIAVIHFSLGVFQALQCNLLVFTANYKIIINLNLKTNKILKTQHTSTFSSN